MTARPHRPAGAWASDAHVAASALRAAGIPATIADLHFQTIYPHIEFGYCRARILVPPQLAEDARAILNNADQQPIAEPCYPCPQCKGPTRRVRRILLMLVITWLGTFFPFFSRRRRCPECRKTWPAPEVAPFSADELGYDPDTA